MQSLKELLDADWKRLATLMRLPCNRRKFSVYFSPRFAPVVLIRISHALVKSGWSRLSKLVSLINFVVFGLEVPSRLEIGPGFILAHTQGTVLGASRIGSNVTIFHQVTLGARTIDFGYDLAQRPIIEDDVTLSTGAKVLGPIIIRRGSTIGANAVVLADVPANSIAVGIPAKVSGNALY